MSHKVSPKSDGEARLKRALTIAGTIAGQWVHTMCVSVCVCGGGVLTKAGTIAGQWVHYVCVEGML